MKIVLCCDKFLYRDLVMGFQIFDEDGDVIGSIFDEDEYDVYWLRDKSYINVTLNPVDGIRDIYLLLIQRSWFTDKQIYDLTKFVQLLHPESKLIFYLDENVIPSFIYHRIVSERSAFLASNMDELNDILASDFSLTQEIYLLDNLKNSQFKKLQRQYTKGK